MVFTNLLRDKSLAPEKACTVLFARGKLKTTMKRHVACCVCQYYASNLFPCTAKFETIGWRFYATGLSKETYKHVEKNIFYSEKIQ